MSAPKKPTAIVPGIDDAVRKLARGEADHVTFRVPATPPTPKRTPGPWRWELRPHSHSILLEGRRGMVMSFERWGMQRATPLFRADGVMEKAVAFGAIEPGREHHDWHRLLDHPDAHLIAAAPDLLEALEGMTEYCATAELPSEFDVLWKAARAAIAKARGAR